MQLSMQPIGLLLSVWYVGTPATLAILIVYAYAWQADVAWMFCRCLQCHTLDANSLQEL